MLKLKEIRKQHNMSQQDLAKILGVTQATLSGWENEKYEIDNKSLVTCADLFNVSIDTILGRTEISFNPPSAKTGKKIPVLGHVAAGIPISAIENILDYEEITPELAITGDFFALSIKGDSMEPRIKDGDVVIVRQQEDVDSGDIAIVCVNGDEATCKKVMKHENSISLVPLNTKYEPMFYTAEEANTKPVRIIGKVVELRGKF